MKARCWGVGFGRAWPRRGPVAGARLQTPTSLASAMWDGPTKCTAWCEGSTNKKGRIPRDRPFWFAGRGRPGTDGSGRGVLELLQRPHLDLHRGGLGREPLLFLGERVDALAARLGRHLVG